MSSALDNLHDYVICNFTEEEIDIIVSCDEDKAKKIRNWESDLEIFFRECQDDIFEFIAEDLECFKAKNPIHWISKLQGADEVTSLRDIKLLMATAAIQVAASLYDKEGNEIEEEGA